MSELTTLEKFDYLATGKPIPLTSQEVILEGEKFLVILTLRYNYSKYIYEPIRNLYGKSLVDDVKNKTGKDVKYLSSKIIAENKIEFKFEALTNPIPVLIIIGAISAAGAIAGLAILSYEIRKIQETGTGKFVLISFSIISTILTIFGVYKWITKKG